MDKVRVLIVDDSVVFRSQIRNALQEMPDVEVVGVAANGRIALDLIQQKSPDLIILDLVMPELDGLSTLRAMKERKSTVKVLVFSSLSKHGAEETMEALRLGANDFVTKPSGQQETGVSSSQWIRQLLEPKITALFPKKSASLVTLLSKDFSDRKFEKVIWELFQPKIVIIGASTGGPTVLEKIFCELSCSVNCPIVIVQHMPPVFTTTFAQRLGKISGLTAFEATDSMVLENNCIYLAPGDYHLRLVGSMAKTSIQLDQGPQVNSVRPAVDPMFTSASALFGRQCLAIVLTGMGMDGMMGAVDVKESGGAVVLQDERSCTVYGMPGSVEATGAYDRIATPTEIVQIMRTKVGSFGEL